MLVNNEKAEGIALKRGVVKLTKGGIYLNNKDQQEYQLIEFIDPYQSLFKNLTTLKTQQMDIKDFDNVSQSDHSVICLDIEDISEAQWHKAKQKLEAINPIISHQPEYAIEGLAKRAKECNVSVRTLQRWIADYSETNSIASLVDRKRGWREGKRRITAQQEEIINEVIDNYYLTVQRPSVQAAINEVNRLCYKKGIEKPSKNAVRYQIDKIDEKVHLARRGYRKRVRDKYEPKAGNFPTVTRPLEVIQIDHTKVDVMIVDDELRKPIARPTITIAIDVYSRMITGYYISLDAPSVTSVGMCLSRSILPKKALLARYGITYANWDVFGVPEKIHVDNATEFRSNSLQHSCALYGITIEYRPVARPEFGGHIERVIKTFMKKTHLLDGTTFSNIQEKAEYDSEKNACMTLDEFESWFLRLIVTQYHESIHGSLDCTPSQKWQIGINGDEFSTGIGIPAIPTDEQSLILDFMPSEQRTIQHKGVTIDGLSYYDPCLNPYINRIDKKTNKKKTFIFRRDPRDISQLWFYNPEINRYFKVPLANRALKPMSLWEFNLIKKQVRASYGKVNEHLLFKGQDEMTEELNSSKEKTKTARLQAQRRKHHTKSQDYHKKPIAQDLTTEIAVKQLGSTDDNLIINTANNADNDLDSDYFEDIE